MDLPDTLADDLYDFAFCPEPCYERLVDLANPEPWGEGNRVLKNYLLFSFKRAVQLIKRDHATAAVPSAQNQTPLAGSLPAARRATLIGCWSRMSNARRMSSRSTSAFGQPVGRMGPISSPR